MRRAVIRERLVELPVSEAAEAIEALSERASAGDRAGRDAALGLASLLVHLRRSGDGAVLDAIAVAAAERDFVRAARLCRGSAAQKALPRRGRLAEVGVSSEGYFPARVPGRVDGSSGPLDSDDAAFQRIARRGWAFFGSELKPLDALLLHPNATVIERLLRARWVRTRDVVRIAARRPSTPAIALAVAADDRWFCDARVRAALAANPFTPSWLADAIRLTLAERHDGSTRRDDAGKVTSDPA